MLASMNLSRRVSTLKPSATLAVSARVRQLKADGVDVIGFGTGEPDFDTPEHIKHAAIDSLLAGNTNYLPAAGEPKARQAVAEKLRRDNGIECEPEHVIITTGGKHAVYQTMQCLIDPPREGEPAPQVILPTPAWLSYRPMIELAGGEVIEVPGSVDNDFKITPDQLESAITEHTAAIIINSPSNPCGTMYSPDELRALANVLEAHQQITIIADEMYEKLIYGGIEHLSLGSLEALADRVVTINGLSKAFAMTGWRIGYACAPGDDGALIKAMSALQSQMTSNITSFNYAALVEALEKGEDDIVTMRDTFAKRAQLISELIERWPNVKCPQPTGAFYAFPDISAYFGCTSPDGRTIDGAQDFAAALLEEAKVAVVPGDDFGEIARRHIRLSFATSDDDIRTGCERIAQWLQSLKPAKDPVAAH